MKSWQGFEHTLISPKSLLSQIISQMTLSPFLSSTIYTENKFKF